MVEFVQWLEANGDARARHVRAFMRERGIFAGPWVVFFSASWPMVSFTLKQVSHEVTQTKKDRDWKMLQAQAVRLLRRDRTVQHGSIRLCDRRGEASVGAYQAR